MSKTAIIIGAGHNGLTAAWYLATRGGMKVQVLERKHLVGGAAVTEEFHPGFCNSTASYSVGLLSPEVVKDMELCTRFGLQLTAKKGAHFLPLSDHDYFQTSYDHQINRERIAKWSARDAEQYDRYTDMLTSLIPLFQEEFLYAPPNNISFRSMRDLIRVGQRGITLTSKQKADLFDLFTRSCGEILDQYFETDPLKGLLGFDAITGNFSSVYAPGSAYVMMHHVMGQLFQTGQWGHSHGGMGSITQAMKEACLSTNHVEILTEKTVKFVTTDGHQKATGVELDDGTQLRADVILSNIHPRQLFLDLLASNESSHTDFYQRIRNYQSGSGSLRMNVALSELPRFTCNPNDPEVYQGSIFISPSLSYIEQAYLDAKQIGYARKPVIEMVTPSVYDFTLAPKGKHVASLFCQHMHPSSESKEEAAEAVIETINQYAPNFRSSIEGKLVLTPLDLQQRFGLEKGDIFHGHLSLSQIWIARPVFGYGRYATPFSGLFLCGSGSHPGGGVTAYPGRNCALEVLNQI